MTSDLAPNKKKQYTLYGVACIFIFMIAITQGMYDDVAPPFTTKFQAVRRTLLPAKILPYINFGFTNMLADYYWIQAVQDYVLWDSKDLFYLNYFYNINTLDPKFEYPYLFSVLAIPRRKDIEMLDRVAVIAEKGIEEIPTSWKIPFYLGTEYYLYTKSFDRAEKYIKIAVSKKDAPPGAYTTYAAYLAKKINGQKTSQQLIKVIYENTDNEVIKKIASLGLQESTITLMLEKGVIAYKAQYKRYPKSVDELQALNLVSIPPEFFDIFTIGINQRDGTVVINQKDK